VSPASSRFERTKTEGACASSDRISHRAFTEAVAWDDGKLKRLGRVDMRRYVLGAFARGCGLRIIAHAKIKTDTIDAKVLAQLYASGFLPEV